MTIHEKIQAQIEETARLLREQSCAVVVIDEGIPYVGVEWLYDDADKTVDGTRSKCTWFCQDDEASELLDDVPEVSVPEDWILWYLDSAGIFSQ